MCGALFATVVLCASPGDTSAQRPQRSGFWAEAGTGPTHVRVACSNCEDVTRGSGAGLFLRVGGTISSRVLLGVESFSVIDRAFGIADDDVVAENATLAAIVLWYPGRSGFFVRGGVGPAGGTFTVISDADELIVSEGIGVGMTFGIGFDVPVSRRLLLTGGAGAWVTAIGDVVLAGLTVDDVIASMYNASVGVVIR
jgi:hypothetical protein